MYLSSPPHHLVIITTSVVVIVVVTLREVSKKRLNELFDDEVDSVNVMCGDDDSLLQGAQRLRSRSVG